VLSRLEKDRPKFNEFTISRELAIQKVTKPQSSNITSLDIRAALEGTSQPYDNNRGLVIRRTSKFFVLETKTTR
jgi:hypothetical protein